jgi:dTMP kinase
MSTEARCEKLTGALSTAKAHGGRFLVFEGIDGAGKSTVSKMVAERLKGMGKAVVHTAEPTSSWLGEAVHRSNKEDVGPFAESLLYIADRAEHTLQIRNWLAEGMWVVCDRYVGSTLAYQSVTLRPCLGAKAMGWLRAVNEPLIIQPSRTFLLRIDPETAMARLSVRSSTEKFEKLEFLRNVDAAYTRIANEDPTYLVVDASLPLESVVDLVMSSIDRP